MSLFGFMNDKECVYSYKNKIANFCFKLRKKIKYVSFILFVNLNGTFSYICFPNSFEHNESFISLCNEFNEYLKFFILSNYME